MKGDRSLLFGHCALSTVGAEFLLAEHLDVTAERDGAELPSRLHTVGPAEQLRPEPDREHLDPDAIPPRDPRSEEHTSELQSLMRISYAVFCLKTKIT